MQALAELCKGTGIATKANTVFNVVKKMKIEKEQKKLAQTDEHMLVDRVSNKCIKTLITANQDFAVILLATIKPQLEHWIRYCVEEEKSSGTAFVLLALCECDLIQSEFIACVKGFASQHEGLKMNEKSGIAILLAKIKSLSE